MKKTLAWLLILAAGTATCYIILERNKKNIHKQTVRDAIIGTWKLDSIYTASEKDESIAGLIAMIDTNFYRYNYEFKKNGVLQRSLADIATNDTMHYQWYGDNFLIWTQYPAGQDTDTFAVSFSTDKSMSIQDKDSSTFIFSRQNK